MNNNTKSRFARLGGKASTIKPRRNKFVPSSGHCKVAGHVAQAISRKFHSLVPSIHESARAYIS